MDRFKNENDRRRFFANYGLYTTLFVSLIFLFINLKKQLIFMAIMDLQLFLVFLAIIILRNRTNREALLYKIGLLSVTLLVLAVIYLGNGGEAGLFWALPIPLVYAFYLGVKEGAVWMGLFTLLSLPSLFNLIPGLPFEHDPDASFRFIMADIIFFSTSFSVEFSRQGLQANLLKRNRELEEALQEIEMLQDILPVCSYCKKVRDDRGYWDQVESYISRREKVLISHSICPTCMEEHFPEEFRELQDRKNVPPGTEENSP